ncbi:MAG: SDR family NAD(P)-dependent oxidoreductase [Pseudomonadota bacterium]
MSHQAPPEKPSALIVGAGGAVGAALADVLEARGPVTRVSSKPGSDLVTDYSEESLASLANSLGRRFDLIVSCTGFLHGDGASPEKSLRQIDSEMLAMTLHRNVIVPALILKHFSRCVKTGQRSVLAVLSARVGSIGDNRAGGWYGYRAGKAALNMLVRNAAIELGRSNREIVVVALHPGTTVSSLSEPFIGRRGAPAAVSPAETAARLLAVIDQLEPKDNGGFFDWKGDVIPW